MDDKIRALIADLNKAAARLKEALELPKSQINRDASIQRFEFTFELTWKLMQAVLKNESLSAYGPRNAIRESAKLGLLDEPQTWFEFLKARNLTSHAYEEKLADEVYTKAKTFVPYLEAFLEKVLEHLA